MATTTDDDYWEPERIQERLTRYPISVDAELQDMQPDGRRAYVRAQRWLAWVSGLVSGVGLAGIGVVLALGEPLFVFPFGLLLLMGFMKQRNPDLTYGLSNARLAEMPPPPQERTWEEHVKLYGNRDGEPLTEEEERALITGEADDPEWRAEHLGGNDAQ